MKLRRLQEMVAEFRAGAAELNQAQVGAHQLLLVEGVSLQNMLFVQGTFKDVFSRN